MSCLRVEWLSVTVNSTGSGRGRSVRGTRSGDESVDRVHGRGPADLAESERYADGLSDADGPADVDRYPGSHGYSDAGRDCDRFAESDRTNLEWIVRGGASRDEGTHQG